MVTSIQPIVQWTTASPVWNDVLSGNNSAQSELDKRRQFRQPMILRFATDTFMDDFIKILSYDASRLWDWRVAKETWRKPIPAPRLPEPQLALPAYLNLSNPITLDEEYDPTADSEDIDYLKLYQPAHKRFYMITASLVCRIPGMPDRKLDVSADERTSFVLRRLVPTAAATNGEPDALNPATFTEYAFINNMWVKVDAQKPNMLINQGENAREDQLPLSPMAYHEADGYSRRLLAGLIPTGARERYQAARLSDAPLFTESGANADNTALAKNPRQALFRQEVLDPWAEIYRSLDRILGNDLADADYIEGVVRASMNQLKTAHDENEDVNLPAGLGKIRDLVKQMQDQLKTASWYILLDFALFMEAYLGVNWATMSGADELFDILDTIHFKWVNDINLAPLKIDTPTHQNEARNAFARLLLGDSANNNDISLLQALKEVYDLKDELDPPPGATRIEDLANFAGPNFLLSGSALKALYESSQQSLAQLIYKYLPEQLPAHTREPEMPIAAAQALTRGASGDAWFAIRCVFERPNCDPYYPTVVSELSCAFQIAGFFDPDAPARPIRIPMPIDTSPAGLRKFAKNTGFMVSDTLCGQINKVRKSISFGDLVLSVLPWPFHKDLDANKLTISDCDPSGNTIGMICSLSIPIITIVAFILLIIFVILLDIVFKWVPYLIMCFPIFKDE